MRKMTWLKSFNLKTLKSLGNINQKLLIILTLVLIIAGGLFIYSRSSSRGVDIEIVIPEEDIYYGVPFSVEARFQNNSPFDLDNVRIALNLPEGLVLLEDPNKVNVLRELDFVGPNNIAEETFVVVALPSKEKDAHLIGVSATYSSGSLSAEFTESEDKKISPKDRDIEVELNLPSNVFIGRDFEITAKYKNLLKEEKELPETLLLIESSQDTTFISSDPSEKGKGKWAMNLGEENEILIKARVESGDQDVLIIKTKAILDFNGEQYVLFEKDFETLLAPSPLTFSVSLRDPKGFAFPGELLTYEINYRNNTNADLKEVVIKSQLLGDMFNFDTLNTDASFDTLSRTISWTPSRFSRLSDIKKGEGGVLSFTIGVKDNFPTEGLGGKNFVLKTKSSIESPTITGGISSDRTASSDVLEIKVAGEIGVNAEGYFRDAQSGILNNGPFPPRVNQATEYSIHWNVVGVGNDLENVVVKSRLSPGVTFQELITKEEESEFSYDEVERQVVWQIDKVLASIGVLSDSPSVIFKIEATPTLLNLGQHLPLLEMITASAKDVFAGVDLIDTDKPLDTKLPDDTTVGAETGKVIQ